MNDWDEFGDESDIYDTCEVIDSLEDAPYDAYGEADVSSIMDSVEPELLEFDDEDADTFWGTKTELGEAGGNNLETEGNQYEATDIFEEEEISGEQQEILENASEITETRPIDKLDTWLGEINPDFDPFDTESVYSNNCGSCAYAVYQRLEGNEDICATAENIEYSSDMEALTGMEQISMDPDEIQARLLEEGDGAHAIVGIDRAEGAGHWFNAANINGKVVAIDGQTGEINDWPPDYGDVVNWDISVKKSS